MVTGFRSGFSPVLVSVQICLQPKRLFLYLPVSVAISSKKGNSFRFISLILATVSMQPGMMTLNIKGGISAAAGIGFKINLIHNKGFLVSFGYRFQQASLVRDNIFENRDYNRLALRAGFYL